jgi:hypothetical protein
MVEALYVLEFGDVRSPDFRNGGVVVLETNRVFGGDSGYYYVGNYEVTGDKIGGSLRVVRHNPAWPNVFGDSATSFDVTFHGSISGDIISGWMDRKDAAGHLPVQLTKKAALP